MAFLGTGRSGAEQQFPKTLLLTAMPLLSLLALASAWPAPPLSLGLSLTAVLLLVAAVARTVWHAAMPSRR